MVQGLAFLSKKSWHTKNLANQEKVWMAEQQKEAEVAKTKELAKQIQQGSYQIMLVF
jgi:anti-sigma28 factor (negative regulator of flagellin synthesis)